MVTPSAAVTPNFDFIAPVYDALAGLVYGQAQKQAQQHFLSQVPPHAQVLVVGGGSGWILQELFRLARPAHVLYLEASGKMLHQAQMLFKHEAPAPLEFRLGTERDLQEPEKFDVVLTPFVLDLFTEPELQTMLQKLDTALRPAGLWLQTDFQLSTSQWYQIWQKPMLWLMYRFFGWASGISAKKLPPLDKLFHQLGYHQRDWAFFFGGFIKTQVLQKSIIS